MFPSFFFLSLRWTPSSHSELMPFCQGLYCVICFPCRECQWRPQSLEKNDLSWNKKYTSCYMFLSYWPLIPETHGSGSVESQLIKLLLTMHQLFRLVLGQKDLSRAGDLFSLDDSEIEDSLTEALEQIKIISSSSVSKLVYRLHLWNGLS